MQAGEGRGAGGRRRSTRETGVLQERGQAAGAGGLADARAGMQGGSARAGRALVVAKC